jgi:hypothetical protein
MALKPGRNFEVDIAVDAASVFMVNVPGSDKRNNSTG